MVPRGRHRVRLGNNRVVVIGELLPALREVHSTYHYLPRRGNLFRNACNGWIFLRNSVSCLAAAIGKALNPKEYENTGKNRVWNTICSLNHRPGWRKRADAEGTLTSPLPHKGVPVRVRPPDTTRGMAHNRDRASLGASI